MISSSNAYQFAITAHNKTTDTFHEINGDIRKVELSAQGMLSKMRKMAGPAAVGLASVGVAGGAAITALVSHNADLAAQVDNLSRLSNTTNEVFQGWAHGAKFVNVEQEKLADILKDTNDKVGDFLATGGGPMQDFFEKIAPKVGVTAEHFRNLSGPDALQLYVNSLQKANLSQAEMTFYMEAIASDSALLLPLLKDNGAAMNEAAKEAEALGLILSSSDVTLLEQTDVAMKRAQDATEAFTKHLSVEFAPIIQAVSNEFLNSAKEAGGFGSVATDVFDVVVKGAAYTANVVRGLQVAWYAVKYAVADVLEGTLGFFETVETGYRLLIDLIPGVEIETTSVLSNLRQSFTNVKNDIGNDLKELASQPLPADGIIQWSQTVKSQAEEAAASIAAAKNGGNADGEVVRPESDPEVLATIARMEYLKNLKDLEIATDTEREELAFQNRLAIAEERFLNVEVPNIEAYNNVKAQLEERHQKRLTEIQNQEITNRETWEQASLTNRVKFSIGTYGKMFQAFGQQSKKMFELGKAASIAETTITTYQMATKSYNALADIPYVGPFLGAAAAAAAIGYGMMQVKNIKKQKYQGGGGVSSGGGPSIPKSASGVTPLSSSSSRSSNSSNRNESTGEKPQNVTNFHFAFEDDDVLNGRFLRRHMEAAAEQSADFNVSFGR